MPLDSIRDPAGLDEDFPSIPLRLANLADALRHTALWMAEQFT